MSLALATPTRAAGDRMAGEGVHQYLTFLLEGRPYGVPLGQVAEISQNRELNRMPHMPKGVEGLLDLRGTVVPVVNLRTRLGFSPLEAGAAGNILILSQSGHLIGILVDQVQSVVTATTEEHTAPSPILAGRDGAWVSGFLLQQGKVTVLLDTSLVVALGQDRVALHHSAEESDLEKRMDEALLKLIDLAPEKSEAEKTRIIPQMEAAIHHTEEEMEKVVARIEQMFAGADAAFKGMARLKQEASLGRLPGQEALLAELEKNTQLLQDQLFHLLQQIQFQDIARQKLERVLNHIRGLQMAIGQKFRDIGKPA